MTYTFKHLSLVAASLLFMGCEGGGSSSPTSIQNPTPSPIPITKTSKNITITQDNQIEDLGKATQVKATINVGDSAKSVYVLLSNSSETQTSYPTLTHNKKMLQTQKSMKRVSTQIHAKRGRHAPAYIQAFNKNVKKLLKSSNTTRQSKMVNTNLAPQKKDTVDTSKKTFYTSVDTSEFTDATARKVVTSDTYFGTKTLNIWVSDDSFAPCAKKKCVTQEMVNALAKTFLQSGDNNDIYDWVTNIYGEEWDANASAKYSNLIGANDEITILLTDIDDDDEVNGGVIGYFYSKDNYKKMNTSDGSNERVMFYIDAVMFANGDGGSSWSIEHAWPKEVVSTLAHEFVHMIEFYQKGVLLGGSSETWLAEMLAETTEDMVATKIQHVGPRNVAYTDGDAGNPNNPEGRYARFNANNTLSLTTWDDKLANYSKVSAFGTYLTRNYGGAQLLHDIMHTTSEDEKAVVDAVNKAVGVFGKTFADLQKEWGIAVMLSDNDNLAPDKPTYNTGDFTVSPMGDVVYKMGSINFFNYTPQPSFTQCRTVQPQGNCYYKVGDNLTGEVNIDLTLNATTSATLIVK